MNRIIVFLLIIFAALAVNAQSNFTAVLKPDTVLEGEPFVLQLSNRGSDMPQLSKLPEQFAYQGSSQSTQIINGDRTVSAAYQFIAPAPGDYEIASLPVKLGKKTVSTPKLKLKVVKDNNASMGMENVFVRGILSSKRKRFYVGEDIPLSINLYYPQNLQVRISAYPALDIGKSVFRDFRKINPENPAYDRPYQQRQIVDEKLYNSIIFPTAFRPLAAGKLQIKGSLSCNILIPEKRHRSDPFDSFFGGGTSYRRIARNLSIELPQIVIEPLPPAPQDGFFLGLTGEYSGKVSLSAEKVNALDVVSMNVALQSIAGSLFETLQVPEMTLPDCRVYPGEVRNDGNICTISYVIVPLKAGSLALKQNFYTFDPIKARYNKLSIDKVLQVAPPIGKSVAQATQKSPATAIEKSERSAEAADLPRTTLLYCKKSPTTAWTAFYRNNRILWAIVLFIAGPLLWLLAWLIHRIRSNKLDHSEIRRERAGQMRSALAEKIANAPVEDLPRLATGELANYLSDRWKLPAGATLEDVAAASEDRALAEAMQECAFVSYLPKAMVKNAISDPERIRKLLLSALKTILVFLSLIVTPAASGNESEQPASWQEALRAYDQGKYKTAKKYFEKYHQDHLSDANVFYNLGCIAEAEGEQEMALYYLEQAGSLAPMDSAVHENRQVMRRKFFLTSDSDAKSPQELFVMLRDRLHPDDYLVIAALASLLFCILMIIRKKLSLELLWSCCGAVLLIMLLALLCMVFQYHSTYQDNRALVVAKNAEIFTFPGKHNGKKTASIAGGTPVKIIDGERDYSLISSGDKEGWTLNENIRKLNIR